MSFCCWWPCGAVQLHCIKSFNPGSGHSSMLVHGKAKLFGWQRQSQGWPWPLLDTSPHIQRCVKDLKCRLGCGFAPGFCNA